MRSRASRRARSFPSTSAWTTSSSTPPTSTRTHRSASERKRCPSNHRALMPPQDDTNGSVLLEMSGICKTFPGVRALDGVDFHLRSGEVHALIGENGAGKSTLIKILTGVHSKDSGVIRLNGKEIAPKSSLEAQELGISSIYQE